MGVALAGNTGMRPKCPLMPNRPVKEAGMRIEAEILKSLSFQIMPGQSKLEFGDGRVLYSDDLKIFAGAFVDGLYRPRARIDSTQHCLSALLKYRALGKGN